MFEQSLLDSQGTKTKTKYTVFVSFVLESLAIGVAILIPLIYTNTLPAYQLMSYLVAPPPPPPPAPPPPVVKIQKIVPREFDAGKLMAPKVIPKKVKLIEESETPPANIAGVVGGVPGGMPGGAIGGVIGGIISSAPVAPPPPPKVEAPKPVTPQRIRVGGNVQKANLINAPRPVYPPLAKQARIQGVVKLHAIIDKSGAIQQLTVVSGHPLLIPSALEAVKQWRYKPTLLNGEPVEVITEIDVNFTLSQ
ncbi:MAG TPA: energy transducer TonB [Bryobacterales bacterium]|nr:energy transducer TonB [Bryobacterales bacterium]